MRPHPDEPDLLCPEVRVEYKVYNPQTRRWLKRVRKYVQCDTGEPKDVARRWLPGGRYYSNPPEFMDCGWPLRITRVFVEGVLVQPDGED